MAVGSTGQFNFSLLLLLFYLYNFARLALVCVARFGSIRIEGDGSSCSALHRSLAGPILISGGAFIGSHPSKSWLAMNACGVVFGSHWPPTIALAGNCWSGAGHGCA